MFATIPVRIVLLHTKLAFTRFPTTDEASLRMLDVLPHWV